MSMPCVPGMRGAVLFFEKRELEWCLAPPTPERCRAGGAGARAGWLRPTSTARRGEIGELVHYDTSYA